MDIAANRQRSRNILRSPAPSTKGCSSCGTAAHQVTARQDSQLHVSTINYPDQQPPGATVPVEIVVVNDFPYIGPSDPNRCTDGFGGPVGLRVRVGIEIDGVFQGEEFNCVPGAGNPPKTFTFNLLMPESEGPFDFTVVGETETSEDVFHDDTETIQVNEESNPTVCSSDSECPGNQICVEGECRFPDQGESSWLPCFLDPNQSCTGGVVQQAMIGAIVVLLIVAVVS